MQKHLLIIGSGYLGSHLAELARTHGHIATLASRGGTGDVLSCDLGDADSVKGMTAHLTEPPDAIVHCASSSRGGTEAYQAVFEKGTENIVSAFPEVPILFTSSTSVYPQIDGCDIDETSPANPDRETGKMLRAGEETVLAAGGTVLRLAGIYGPQRSVYLKRIHDGSATIESGDVSRWVNQIHRDDAANAILHLLDYPNAAGEIYNVCDDAPMSQREVYLGLAARLDKPTPPEAPPNMNRKRAWTHKRVINQKLKSTGWTPTYPHFIKALDSDPRLLAAFS
ncbi:MAG: NAD-dependent epimerase/dehydratase family protein [Verrucomicrobiota bacterium]